MKQILVAFRVVTFAFLMLLVGACNDPTFLGSDLVEEDASDMQKTDTLSFGVTTFLAAPPVTYIPGTGVYFPVQLCGKLENPVFGKETASIHQHLAQYITSNLIKDFGFDDLIHLDSVIMTIYPDTLYTYGDTLAPFGFDVYRVTETMDYTTRHKSDKSFTTESTPIGSLQVSKPFSYYIDSVQTQGVKRAVKKLKPYRVPISNVVGSELLSYDSLTYSSSTRFIEKFKGIHIKPKNNVKAMIGLNTTSVDFRVHYTADPDTSKVWRISRLGSGVVHGKYEHDYSNTVIDDFLSDATKGDSLIFFQGMVGTKVLLDFPSARSLGKVAINKAELEMTMAVPLTDTLLMPDYITCGFFSSDGTFVRLGEAQAAVLASNRAELVFGGVAEDKTRNGVKLKTYRLNIASYFQDIVDGEAEDKPIYIQVLSPHTNTSYDYTTQNCASKGVFFGPKHSKYPMRFTVHYTKLNR